MALDRLLWGINWRPCFAVAGPRSWNSLLPALHSTSKSFSSFKKELKSFFSVSHFGRDIVNIDYIKRSSNSLYHIIALNKLSKLHTFTGFICLSVLSFSSISFCFSYSYVRQTKLVSSLVNVWAHYKIVIDCVIDWLIDWLVGQPWAVIIRWTLEHVSPLSEVKCVRKCIFSKLFIGNAVIIINFLTWPK